MEQLKDSEPKSLPTRLSGMIGRVLDKTSRLRHRSKRTMASLPLVRFKPKDIHPAVLELQSLVGSFYTRCHQCKSELWHMFRTEQIETWRAGAQEIPPTVQFSGIRCKHGHSTCAGCGGDPVLSGKQLFTSIGVLDHCCSAGRLYGLWILLSRFDERELRPTTPNPTQIKKKPTKKPVMGTPSGVGYAGDHIDPYTYYDDMVDNEDFEMEYMMPGYHHLQGAQLTSNHSENERTKDNLMIETLKLVEKFLPAPGTEAHQEINLFRLSLLFDTIIELIRNDSIEDINKRRELFLETCKFVTAIANHSELVALVLEDLPRKHSPGIRILGSEDDFGRFEADNHFEIKNIAASSFFQACTNTYRQSKTFLKLSQKTESTDNRTSSIQICESIIQMYELLETIVASKNPHIDTDVALNENASDQSWPEFSEENRVTFTDEVLVSHRYSRDADKFVASALKDRLVRISREVATLSTSLPPGIFLKIAESRIDVFKVLIVGSADSPYAGGLYTFDLFLPSNYPIGPPKMAFVLDGNDSEQHSFNPNLHKGGTVCLSILNTWHGNPSEMWQPNKSTILSVLISIQAMILGAPMPWLNEPGMEVHGDTVIAVEHKYLIQAKTIKYAMIAWVEQEWRSGTKELIWKDIVQTYWKYHATQALEYAKEWSTENPRLRTWSDAHPQAPTKKAQKSKVKNKGKGKAPETDEDAEGDDLVARLAMVLGLEAQAPPQPMKQEESSETGKRKVSEKGVDSSAGSHQYKKHKPDVVAEETRWVYNSGRSQKEVRAVCKEFGIGHASTIKDTILKIEAHVNEKGKTSTELSNKYGTLTAMTDDAGTNAMTGIEYTDTDMTPKPTAW